MPPYRETGPRRDPMYSSIVLFILLLFCRCDDGNGLAPFGDGIGRVRHFPKNLRAVRLEFSNGYFFYNPPFSK